MAIDTNLFLTLRGFVGQSALGDAIVIFFAEYFAYALVAAFCPLLLLSKYATRKKIEIFLTVCLSVVISRFVVTEIIRLFCHRLRPFAAYGFHPLIPENAYSFPSGHAAFFFAMGAAIFCYNKKWGFGFFAAAVIMGIARVMAGVHYPSDILGGMVVGTLTAAIVYSALSRLTVFKSGAVLIKK